MRRNPTSCPTADDCCTIDTAKSVVVTLFSTTAVCKCTDGVTFHLTYDSGSESWLGSGQLCGKTVDVSLLASDQPGCDCWLLTISEGLGNCGGVEPANAPCSCDPLLMEFGPFEDPDDGCCSTGGGGEYCAIVTE